MTKPIKLNPTLLCDFYMLSHPGQQPKSLVVDYKTWTARGSRVPGVTSTVLYGLQGTIQTWFIDYFRDNFFNAPIESVLEQCLEAIQGGLMIQDPDLTYIIELHELGYLPIEVCAVPEGTSVPVRVPSFTLANTHEGFAWVVGALETLVSNETWLPITIATTARQYRQILDGFALETTGSTDGVEFQAHDFSLRGLHGMEFGAKCGGGHLLYFTGTDNIPSMFYLKDHYKGCMENMGIGGSIPATQHSIECMFMPDDGDEYAQTKRLLTEIYPTGLFSRVSDTLDFWNFIEVTLPRLKSEIMARDGKFVIRPDSGDPVDIICGNVIRTVSYDEDFEGWKDYVAEAMDMEFRDNLDAENPHHEESDVFRFKDKVYNVSYEPELNRYDKQYYFVDNNESDESYCTFTEIEVSTEQKGLIESLWDQFGGTVNDLGYKVLDSHIGAIYGDSITPERAEKICQRLKDKGFASTNIVLGVGSYSYGYHTRDTYMQAFKSTYCMLREDGIITEKMLFKDPKTDDGTKKSQRGMVAVVKGLSGQLELIDGLDALGKAFLKGRDELVPIFRDSIMLTRQTLPEIRERVLLTKLN